MSQRFTNQLFREQATYTKSSMTIDRDAGVIRGVKILGYESSNKRRYTKEAVAKAKSLYEGRAVNVDHALRGNKPTGENRSSYDRFGWLEGVEEREDGLYGNLNILDPTETLAKKLFRAAEKKPDLFGLSHNARGDGFVDRSTGVEVIEQILEVISVDLVTEPATTDGLFEERRMANRIKIRAFLEGQLSKFDGGKRTAIKKLLEENTVKPAMEMDEPTVDAKPEDAMTAAFSQAGASTLQSIFAGDMDAGEGLKKIKQLIDSHFKLNGVKPTDDAEVEEEEEEEPDGDEKDGKKLEARLRRIERREKAYELCEEAGVQPDKTLIEAMVGLGSESKMLALVEREKARGTTPAKSGQKPRSQSPGSGQPLVESKIPKDAAGVASFLRSGR